MQPILRPYATCIRLSYVCHWYVQGERKKSADVDSTDSGASTRSFETRLKICALGFDTPGTLAAVSDVLCAAIRGDQGGSRLENRANGLATQEPMPGVREEKKVDSEGGRATASGSGAVGPRKSVNSRGKDDTTAASDAAKTVALPHTRLSAESSPTALWSIRFAVPHLEKVLNALEVAVSGLMFVVVGASEGAKPETSTLW